MSQAEWLTAGRALACAHRANQILTGDYLLDADNRWKDESKREELIKQLGFSKKSLRNMKSTAKQVPPEVRRADVSYSALAAVAPLHEHPEWQRALLFAAAPAAGSKAKEHHKINLAALRESVRQTQEKNELVIVKQAEPNKSHHVKVLQTSDTKKVSKFLSTVGRSLPPRTEIFKCKDAGVVLLWHKAFDQVLRFGVALTKHLGHLAKGNATDRQPKKTERKTTKLSQVVPNADEPAIMETEHENGKSWLAPLAASVKEMAQ